MKKIQILQILPSDDPGIYELSTHISSSFNTSQYNLTTAFLHTPSRKITNDNVISFNFTKSETSGLRIKALLRLYRYCRQQKFQLIITHRFKPLYLVLILNKLLNIPNCIGVIHGFDDFKRSSRKYFLNLLWSKNWLFVGISEPVSEYLRTTLKSNQNTAITINNCIDVLAISKSFKTKATSKEILGLQKKSFVFGTIGRLVSLKGHMLLVKAFKTHLVKNPNSQLIIIGEGKERARLEAYINDHKLTNYVVLAGHIDGASSLIKAFDVFVLPSLKEGFGIVLLEAMAAKLPIIANSVGGIPHVLGGLGTLITLNGDKDQLANAMNKHINLSLKESDDIAQKLHERLISNFDINDYQISYRKLIQQRLNH